MTNDKGGSSLIREKGPQPRRLMQRKTPTHEDYSLVVDGAKQRKAERPAASTGGMILSCPDCYLSRRLAQVQTLNNVQVIRRTLTQSGSFLTVQHPRCEGGRSSRSTLCLSRRSCTETERDGQTSVKDDSNQPVNLRQQKHSVIISFMSYVAFS